MKKMTKNGLALEVSKLLGLPHTDGKRITDAVFLCLQDAMIGGRMVEIRNFGTWHQRVNQERVGHNPKTGELLTIPALKKVLFRSGKLLRDGVRGG